ncbi:MAG: calcium-binding protein [Planctomycetota bacterium]
MRRFIVLPSMVAVLLSGCDGSGEQDLVAPGPSFARATAQEQIAALGCEAYWLDYSVSEPPRCFEPPPPGCPEHPACLAFEACLLEREAWFAANQHDDGFTVKGRSIYGTEHRDKILCNPVEGDRPGALKGVKLFGLEGDDVLIGGLGDDEISGGKGCDRIRGWDGDDLVDGGPGNDNSPNAGGCRYFDISHPSRGRIGVVDGSFGDDVLLGGPGTDWLFGGDGIDECDVGPPGEGDRVDLCEMVGG